MAEAHIPSHGLAEREQLEMEASYALTTAIERLEKIEQSVNLKAISSSQLHAIVSAAAALNNVLDLGSFP